jgi:hypothetical protein
MVDRQQQADNDGDHYCLTANLLGGQSEVITGGVAKRTDGDYQAWRDQRDWTARKYAMWERGEKLPSQIPTSMMGCPCGVRFDSHDPAGSYVHRGHIYAAQADDGIRR